MAQSRQFHESRKYVSRPPQTNPHPTIFKSSIEPSAVDVTRRSSCNDKIAPSWSLWEQIDAPSPPSPRVGSGSETDVDADGARTPRRPPEFSPVRAHDRAQR